MVLPRRDAEAQRKTQRTQKAEAKGKPENAQEAQHWPSCRQVEFPESSTPRVHLVAGWGGKLRDVLPDAETRRRRERARRRKKRRSSAEEAEVGRPSGRQVGFPESSKPRIDLVTEWHR